MGGIVLAGCAVAPRLMAVEVAVRRNDVMLGYLHDEEAS